METVTCYGIEIMDNNGCAFLRVQNIYYFVTGIMLLKSLKSLVSKLLESHIPSSPKKILFLYENL